jgi:hypothetical protein
VIFFQKNGEKDREYIENVFKQWGTGNKNNKNRRKFYAYGGGVL